MIANLNLVDLTSFRALLQGDIISSSVGCKTQLVSNNQTQLTVNQFGLNSVDRLFQILRNRTKSNIYLHIKEKLV